MADSIHDQWPVATQEWPNVTAQFNAAWISVDASYDVNSYYAGFAAAISYLARMLEDSTVMAGDMITHLAQTGQDGAKGTIQNFQVLSGVVLPAWGALAAAYAEARAQAWTAHEAANRVAADQQEATARAAGDLAVTNLIAAGDQQEAVRRAAADAALLAAVNALIGTEATARAAGDAASRQQAQAGDAAVTAALTAQVNTVLQYAQSLPALVDDRAASGYDPTLRDRGGLLQKLIDTAIAHDPAVASLVGKLATMIIDLAGVEDPVLRVAAQLILKQVIDRFGLDTALHQMLGDLLGSIIGGGQPKTLQAVTADIGNRLDTLEGSVASLAPLAPEADDLHTMGTLIFDAALLGYVTAAIADPVAAANDTVNVLAPVTTPLLAPLRALLGMP
jgi:hypothetical protein